MGLFDGFFSGGQSVQVGSLSALSEKNGFRDLKFGCSVQSVEGLLLVGEMDDSGRVLYTRPSDTLKIGEADLEGINYVFYRDQLYSITLHLSSYQEFNRLMEVFLKAYGRPEFLQGIDDYSWTTQSVRLFSSWDPVEESGFSILTSLPLESRAKLDRDEDASRGVSDL